MGMLNPSIEHGVYQYVVTLHLLKALELDRRQADGMKLSRIWNGVFEHLSKAAEREHREAKRSLKKQGCRIVLEELTPERNYHVMYVVRGYEFHCSIMPVVLKGKCEEKLQELLSGGRAQPIGP
ncbi:hypothetical protein N0M98_04385 [Paenibacillus doosanensis]|uniref:hypothetical protein n=1 Tax=Paenibacillus doosanensis TaxID=1229154 RepID=UPI00217F532D|nr:hypothetical protein [Paenibacillus doosanensis]MCS7459368.1 hypothetical protein [Paenibacillus doosanensis]